MNKSLKFSILACMLGAGLILPFFKVNAGKPEDDQMNKFFEVVKKVVETCQYDDNIDGLATEVGLFVAKTAEEGGFGPQAKTNWDMWGQVDRSKFVSFQTSSFLIKEEKRGICQHFATYLDGVLHNIGVKHWLLTIPPSKVGARDGHVANAYIDPRNGELRIVDATILITNPILKLAFLNGDHSLASMPMPVYLGTIGKSSDNICFKDNVTSVERPWKDVFKESLAKSIEPKSQGMS